MRYLFIFLASFLLGLNSISAHAENISLLQTQSKPITVYENPDAKSKVIATISAGETIIPFFEQKDWIKMADPKNGQVGWVIKTELSKNTQTVVSINNPGANQYIVTQKSKAGGSTNTYSVVEYSNDPKVNQQQAAELIKQIQTQQQQMQERFNKIFAQPIVIIQQPVKAEEKNSKK